MRSSPLLLFGASGVLAGNYTEHKRPFYNASASTATTLAYSTGSASGYMFLNTAPATLRTSVLPAASANWTTSVSMYGARRQKTETSMISSSASSAGLATTNYTISVNGSVAATHAPVPLFSTPAPVYTAWPRTNHSAVANVTMAAPYAAAAYPTVSVAAVPALPSAPAHPSAWPPTNHSVAANGTSEAPLESPHRHPYVFVPSNSTYNSSLSPRPPSPALASSAPAASSGPNTEEALAA